MLLCIDIGNTNTVIGLIDKERILKHWRLRTDQQITSDEMGMMLSFIISSNKIKVDMIDGVIISSVVPPLIDKIKSASRKYLNKDPIIVNSDMNMGISISYDNPKELGTDRIVNVVGAYAKYKRGAIVIDFGTATTFDYISPKGIYMGGIIVPGISISAEALFKNAYRLPKIDKFYVPKSVLAKNTVDSINTGIIYGYACLVDGIVKKIKDETEERDSITVATGGLAHLIKDVAKSIDIVDEVLTIYGLMVIYKFNSERC